MAQNSPLNKLYASQDASFLQYGPVAVVETFGELEAEYAAIRKGCVLLDMPHRGTIEVTGAERLEFLNRMLTQELKGVQTGDVRRTFWLNRKGRIEADIRLIEMGDRTWFDLDVTVAADAIKSLEAYVFAEDAHFTDRSETMHRLALHGAAATSVLQVAGVSPPDIGSAVQTEVGGASVLLDRYDSAGSPGYELMCSVDEVETVSGALQEAGASSKLRMAGWHAYNIARIESGTALFNVDFGTSSLPHETGVLHDRVSFTKGCYLGQEVVARLESLGHPKQILRGVRIESGDDGSPERQPMEGASVFAAESDDNKVIGGVTSSTRSPMLGDTIICFAQMKWKHASADTRVRVDPGVEGMVRDELRFWPSPE